VSGHELVLLGHVAPHHVVCHVSHATDEPAPRPKIGLAALLPGSPDGPPRGGDRAARPVEAGGHTRADPHLLVARFEGGDPDYPIWGGCFWGVGEVPAQPAVPLMKVFKTDAVSITLSDIPGIGGLTIEVNPPAVAMPLKLSFDVSGIEITGGAASVKLTPISVSINNGALEVM
jgi:hypothetical protein